MEWTTAAAVARAFLKSWVYPYGITLYFLTGKESQFVSKFFEAECTKLCIKHVTITASHSRTNRQAERFKKTLVERLRHYVVSIQTKLHDYVQPLTYAYTLHVHHMTGSAPFDLVLTRQLPALEVETPNTALPDDGPEAASVTQVKRYIRARRHDALASTPVRRTQAQRQYKLEFDKTVWNLPKPQHGDEVFVETPKWMYTAP